MLPNEKRRVIWSLAIGAVIGLSYASWDYWDASKIDARVGNLVQQCEQARAKFKYPTYGEWEKMLRLDSKFSGENESVQSEILEEGKHMYLCNPSDLTYKYDLKGIQQQIDTTHNEASGYRNDAQLFGGGIFLVFCLPLVWYLLLGRIREISAAITGRDRDP